MKKLTSFQVIEFCLLVKKKYLDHEYTLLNISSLHIHQLFLVV